MSQGPSADDLSSRTIMRTIIAGRREFPGHDVTDLIATAIVQAAATIEITEVVSGCCRGID